MVALDWVLLAALLASALLGAWRGLVYEVLSLLGWVGALLAAQWLAPAVAQALPLGDVPSMVRYAAGFVLVFVAALFLAGLVAWVIKKAVEKVGLRPIDRVLGWLFGLVRGVLVLLLVALLLRWTPWHDAPLWKESVAAGWLDHTINQLRPLVPPSLASHLPA